MLKVKTPSEVLEIIETEFQPREESPEYVSLYEALGRSLYCDTEAKEYVPDFDRSTVDGYALKARDSFGCTSAIPAILPVQAEIKMGENPDFVLKKGSCAEIPTGGALPEGADCVQMLEYSEDYGDGSIGILKPAAPGQNLIFRGDDVYPGKKVLSRGRVIRPQDIGALAAMGIVSVPVTRKLRIGLISSGDELIPPDKSPKMGQIRDVNGPAVQALLRQNGYEVNFYGIVEDDEKLLLSTAQKALSQCDGLIISGGSSVGEKDAAIRIIKALGELLFHGIAIKPGKPTILGKCGNKPLIGLPGHPAAAFFITKLFVLPLLNRISGRSSEEYTVSAVLSENISANHGRAELVCVKLREEDGKLTAEPVRGKSGLITTLALSDGYFLIERDCEGLSAGAEIKVHIS